MQWGPIASSVIRRFRRRIGEKVAENFLWKIRRKVSAAHGSSAGRSRHAGSFTEFGARFDYLKFLTLCVSHARRAPPVRSNEFCLTDCWGLSVEISLYSQSSWQPRHLNVGVAFACEATPTTLPATDARQILTFRDSVAAILTLAHPLLAPARWALGQFLRSEQ
jgi:hypothetical protein